MPEICRFYGIIIRLYFADHNPPYFHAEYAGCEVRIEIKTLAIISGKLPARAQGLVTEWATLPPILEAAIAHVDRAVDRIWTQQRLAACMTTQNLTQLSR